MQADFNDLLNFCRAVQDLICYTAKSMLTQTSRPVSHQHTTLCFTVQYLVYSLYTA